MGGPVRGDERHRVSVADLEGRRDRMFVDVKRGLRPQDESVRATDGLDTTILMPKPGSDVAVVETRLVQHGDRHPAL
jgi:hypothetical protein